MIVIVHVRDRTDQLRLGLRIEVKPNRFPEISMDTDAIDGRIAVPIRVKDALSGTEKIGW